MKNCELFWTYVAIAVGRPSFLEEDDYEIFVSFYPTYVEDSTLLTITPKDFQKWFWPEIFDYLKEYKIHDKGQTSEEVFNELSAIGKLEVALCNMLNYGPGGKTFGLIRPLEEQAFKTWKKN